MVIGSICCLTMNSIYKFHYSVPSTSYPIQMDRCLQYLEIKPNVQLLFLNPRKGFRHTLKHIFLVSAFSEVIPTFLCLERHSQYNKNRFIIIFEQKLQMRQ